MPDILYNLVSFLQFLAECLLICSSHDDDFVIPFCMERIESWVILFWQWFPAWPAQNIWELLGMPMLKMFPGPINSESLGSWHCIDTGRNHSPRMDATNLIFIICCLGGGTYKARDAEACISLVSQLTHFCFGTWISNWIYVCWRDGDLRGNKRVTDDKVSAQGS